MSIPAIETMAPPTGMLASTSTAGAGSADKEMFLQLLVAQLRYQDPMNPSDTSEFLSQSAQFTALEKMQSVADQTGALLGAQMAFGGAQLVGRQVTYTLGDGTEGSGLVSGVTFGPSGPVLDVGGIEVPIFQVQSVTDGSPTSTTTPTTPAATAATIPSLAVPAL
ncbi:flagellar hook capping FlgD N-terminal domain-containing protein [Nocardioides psychrotolerans]|uniref:flagellar hook assembly protein FlgD n=1 Tax=Nocardioides psychrotolerans TaxID=1005945 RepID=UPI0031380102